MKTVKFVLLICITNVLLMSSCTKIPDINDKDITFQKHMKTLKFAPLANRNVQFEDFSYRPYVRFVKPSCSETMMLKVLFLKKDNHSISKVSFSRKKNGEHYLLAIQVTEDSAPVADNQESAVELRFTLKEFEDMRSFFERKKTAYFEVGIINASKNDDSLGYMIVSNDSNGGTLDPPPFVENKTLCE